MCGSTTARMGNIEKPDCYRDKGGAHMMEDVKPFNAVNVTTDTIMGLASVGGGVASCPSPFYGFDRRPQGCFPSMA